MSDSVRPHRCQPTRLPYPWDSPGKNTGAGCHFLLQCMKVKSESEVAQPCSTLRDPMDCSLPGSSIHGIFQARVLEWGAIANTSPNAQSRNMFLKKYKSGKGPKRIRVFNPLLFSFYGNIYDEVFQTPYLIISYPSKSNILIVFAHCLTIH